MRLTDRETIVPLLFVYILYQYGFETEVKTILKTISALENTDRVALSHSLVFTYGFSIVSPLEPNGSVFIQYVCCVDVPTSLSTLH